MLTGQRFDGVQVRQNSVEGMTFVAFIAGTAAWRWTRLACASSLCVVGFIARIKIDRPFGVGSLNMAVQDPVDAEAGREHAKAGDDRDD